MEQSAGEPRRTKYIDPDVQGRRTLLRILRVAFVALVLVVITFYIIDLGADQSETSTWEDLLIRGWQYVLVFGLAIALGFLAIDVLTPGKKIATLSGVFLGLLAGVLAALAIALVIDLLAEIYELEGNRIINTIKVLFGVAFCYLGVSIVLQTQDDFRLVIPYVEFAKQTRGVRPLLLDTSVLIDGRLLEAAESGIIQSPVVIPRFVIAELQALADSADRLKRTRGRRGLEMVGKMQRSPRLDVSVDDTPVPGKSVDQMLVELGRQLSGSIVTTDIALARVGKIHGVTVINLNDVALSMKPSFIPGERLRVTLIKPGEQPEQGVGYLEDGTMIVAENGRHAIGKTVDLVVATSLQTSAGKLIFARIPDDANPDDWDTPEGDDEPDHDRHDANQPPSDDEGPSARARRGARNPRRR
ncbi:MAG: PIN/TRAM domain-containing protein [Phycisphaerales bacterium]